MFKYLPYLTVLMLFVNMFLAFWILNLLDIKGDSMRVIAGFISIGLMYLEILCLYAWRKYKIYKNKKKRLTNAKPKSKK
jgi:small neutral amino acid transporter SnatA (MarC family)